MNEKRVWLEDTGRVPVGRKLRKMKSRGKRNLELGKPGKKVAPARIPVSPSPEGPVLPAGASLVAPMPIAGQTPPKVREGRSVSPDEVAIKQVAEGARTGTGFSGTFLPSFAGGRSGSEVLADAFRDPSAVMPQRWGGASGRVPEEIPGPRVAGGMTNLPTTQERLAAEERGDPGADPTDYNLDSGNEALERVMPRKMRAEDDRGNFLAGTMTKTPEENQEIVGRMIARDKAQMRKVLQREIAQERQEAERQKAGRRGGKGQVLPSPIQQENAEERKRLVREYESAMGSLSRDMQRGWVSAKKGKIMADMINKFYETQLGREAPQPQPDNALALEGMRQEGQDRRAKVSAGAQVAAARVRGERGPTPKARQNVKVTEFGGTATFDPNTASYTYPALVQQALDDIRSGTHSEKALTLMVDAFKKQFPNYGNPLELP